MSNFPNEHVAAAMDAVLLAQAEAIAAIESSYPVGSKVIMHHHRGQFEAKVSYIFGQYNGFFLGYVGVVNERTGKASKCYYSHLERL